MKAQLQICKGRVLGASADVTKLWRSDL